MDSTFVLRKNTKLIAQFDSSLATAYAMNAFRRDMDKVLLGVEMALETKILLYIEKAAGLAAEAYTITFDDENTMRVTGADDVGLIFALYFLSENFLEILPFWYWNDQHIATRQAVWIPAKRYDSPEYRVRYRGWFVNDEVLLEGWHSPDGKEAFKWQMVFEAMMRLGGNLCIAGTDRMAKKNRKIASDMGLWITHHHAEPLGAEMFSRAFPEEEPSYFVNARLFEKLWMEAIEGQKSSKTIWSIGFRGQGDMPFWDNDPRYSQPTEIGNLLSEIMQKQTDFIRERVPGAILSTNLYGEILELYKQGLLKVPDGVIKIWADNGYGCMVSRRQGNHNPRLSSIPSKDDAGPHGIYYHCSFHDLQASNHLTMSPVPYGIMAAKLNAAFEAGADELLIVNCGSVKPHAYPLQLMGELWREGKANTEAHLEAYVRSYYDQGHDVIADCLRAYSKRTATYGLHEDDRAGEQLYHHPVREMLCAVMCGQMDRCLNSLVWLAGEKPFVEQLDFLDGVAEQAQAGLDDLFQKARACAAELKGHDRQRFEDSLLLQISLHALGAKGTRAFCKSVHCYMNKSWRSAFVVAAQALEAYESSVRAMEQAQHDKWVGFYENDCLTNIRLTRDMMRTYVGHIRILGDGPSFHRWERECLMSKGDRGVMLLSTSTVHLGDKELAARLCQQSNQNQ